MHPRHRRPRPLAALFAAAALCTGLPALAAQITDVRIGAHPKFTRVVFELDGRAGYRIERAGTDAAPELRITIEAQSSTRELRAVGDVRGVKVDAGTKARARIALRDAGLRVHEMMLSDPPRIVVDLLKSETAVAATAKPEPGKPKAEAKESPKVEPKETLAPAPKETAKAEPKQTAKTEAKEAPKSEAKETPAPAPAPKVAPPPSPAPVAPKTAAAPPAPAPAPKVAPPPSPAPVAPKTAAAPPAPPAPPKDAAVNPPAPAPAPAPAVIPAPRVTPPPSTAAQTEKPAPPPATSPPKPAPSDAAHAVVPPAPAPTPIAPPAVTPAPTPDSAAKLQPPPPVPTPEPSPVRPTPAPVPAPAPHAMPAQPSAPAPSWSGRLTSDPIWIWIGGIAAALLGLAAIGIERRRRRALPNDLDVTAIAEEIEQTSESPGRIPSGGFAMGDDDRTSAAASDNSSFAGLFDKPAETAAPAARPEPMVTPPTAVAAAEDSLFDDAGEMPGEPDVSEGDAPMNQEMDLPVDRRTTQPAAQMGGSAAAPSPDLVHMLQDMERRIATLEARLDESNEAREKLERQVAAQSEELRVQRAAIARTQRALRTMTRGEEDKATEPALRDGDTQAKTRVTP